MRLPSRVRLGYAGVLFANERERYQVLGGWGGMTRLLDNRFQATIVALHCTISKKCAHEYVCMSNIIGAGLTI